MNKLANKEVGVLLVILVRLGRWAIFLELVILIALFFKFRLSTRIERDVIKTQAQLEMTEKHLIDNIKISVERWDKLKADNPDIKVPKIELASPIPTPSK